MEAGGAQGAAIRMSEELVKKGYNSKTWFLYKKKDTYSSHDLAFCFFDRKPIGVFENIKLLYAVYKKLKKEKADVVILYTHFANVIGGFLAKLSGVNNIIATHRSKIELYPKSVILLDKLFGLIGIYNKKVFVSKVVVDSFQGFPKKYFENSLIIPNGIEKKICNQDKEILFEKYNIPKNKFLAISTGRLISYKNQKFLIDTVAKIDNDNLVLLLAGDGEDKVFLEKYIYDNNLGGKVYLLGEVEPLDVRCLLEIADLFLFASQTESFGFSVLEAMSAKLPIVCNNIDALAYLVGESGFVLSTSKQNEWIDSINNLMHNKELREKYSTKAYEKSKQFTLKNMVLEYEKLFNGEKK